MTVSETTRLVELRDRRHRRALASRQRMAERGDVRYQQLLRERGGRLTPAKAT